nr:immunoglobulin light chain junction region [Macaca mulatta]
CMQSTKDPFTF